MYVYMQRMTKVVSLSDEAYHGLKGIMAPGESFTGVVLRIVEKEKKKPLLDFFGKWPGNKGELDVIKKTLARDRKNFKTREVKFV